MSCFRRRLNSQQSSFKSSSCQSKAIRSNFLVQFLATRNKMKLINGKSKCQGNFSIPIVCCTPRTMGRCLVDRRGVSCWGISEMPVKVTKTGAWSEPSSFVLNPPFHLPWISRHCMERRRDPQIRQVKDQTYHSFYASKQRLYLGPFPGFQRLYCVDMSLSFTWQVMKSWSIELQFWCKQDPAKRIWSILEP